MGRKLLFFDIDGTLFDGRKVPKSAAWAIKQARKNGHLAFVNTGRTIISVDDRIRDVGFDGYICGCGNYICIHDKVLYSNMIAAGQAREVMEAMRRFKIPAAYEGNEAVYFDADPECGDERIRVTRKFCKENGRNIPMDLQKLPVDFSIVKFICFYQEDSEREKAEAYLAERFTCINSGWNIKEVVPKDNSKGTGIRFLCGHLKADISDCYAFGDSENDIEMFRAVPNAIAMGNSSPALLQYSTYQTASVNEDGIQKALSHFGII